jgi:tetratricopeptide (TPR) repeat protein
VYRPLQNEAAAPAQVADLPGQGAGAAQNTAQPQAEQVAKPAGPVDQQPATVEQAAPVQATSVAALDTAGNEADGQKVQQKLEEARQLYWQKNVGAATEAYEALGREYPNDANIWGEIGNFYYSVQQTESAGTAYYRTVSLLIDKGDTQKARQLLGVLYELDANRGRELEARLQQTVE